MNTGIISIIIIISAFIIAGLLLYIYKQHKKLKEVTLKNAEADSKYQLLESKVHALQLENLQSKLNPHLFKNVLNSIQSHAYQTYYALDKLANVLDFILYESSDKFVSAREEIEFAQNLIDINKIKISPLFQLSVKQRIDENDPLFEQPLVAPLISIDLIENAFKHADLQSADAFINIVFEYEAGKLSLTVSNKMSKQPPLKNEKGGLGATTLEHRLKLIYGNHFQLNKIEEKEVYIANLKIDLLEYKNKMLNNR